MEPGDVNPDRRITACSDAENLLRGHGQGGPPFSIPIAGKALAALIGSVLSRPLPHWRKDGLDGKGSPQ
jgi:hypothetical protein